MDEKPFSTTKHFVHHVELLGKHLLTVTYDLEIPLPNQNCAPADLFGHLLSQNRPLPLPFHEDVRAKFEKFVRDEIQKFDAELATLRIESALNAADENLGDTLVAAGGSNNSSGTDDGGVQNCDANNRHGMPLSVVNPNENEEGQSPFEEQFQHLMRNASAVKLSLLVTEESRMTEEMRALVRARNFEVERIKRACEQVLAQSVIDAADFDKHSYTISMLNEKLRQITINYSNQIEALNEQQRHEYRQLVHALNANEMSVFSEGKKEFASSASSFNCDTMAQMHQQTHSSSRPFKKSLSCDSKLMALHQQQHLPFNNNNNEIANFGRRRPPTMSSSQCRSESFTIYIGAQLKTMHNARILTCDQLVDLLTVENGANGICQNAKINDNRQTLDNDDVICHSQRLQLLMNLYRRDLACAVLFVGGSDPLWHVKERTKFAQLCEQSAELHFDSLERQLMKIEQDVMKANRERRAAAIRRQKRQRQQQQQQQDEEDDEEKSANSEPKSASAAESALFMTADSENDGVSISEVAQGVDGVPPQQMVEENDKIDDDGFGDVNTLRPGDVYVTCHSNLSAVQVLFHIVGDRLLIEQDISSRHPCIGALRNVIRLAPHSGIHHITFPLLLVEHMSETMTISWCLSRAELVFKCLKGFLMEVCSSGVSTAIAGGGGAVIGASANAGGTPHFNINFVLPSAISPALFQQLVELFSSIFHSVPSLNATQQQQ